MKSGSGNLVTACHDLLLFVLPNSSSNQPSNFALRILAGEMSRGNSSIGEMRGVEERVDARGPEGHQRGPPLIVWGVERVTTTTRWLEGRGSRGDGCGA
eukprot:COSAG06_NODE_1526_length_9195_cov_12.000330_2_plen_99_part_00